MWFKNETKFWSLPVGLGITATVLEVVGTKDVVVEVVTGTGTHSLSTAWCCFPDETGNCDIMAFNCPACLGGIGTEFWKTIISYLMHQILL